jgi:signal recognition particle GTPase
LNTNPSPIHKQQVAGKLTNYLKIKKTKKPLLVTCYVYRPAAISQLHVEGKLNNCSWDDKDENKCDTTEVVCNELLLFGK